MVNVMGRIIAQAVISILRLNNEHENMIKNNFMHYDEQKNYINLCFDYKS